MLIPYNYVANPSCLQKQWLLSSYCRWYRCRRILIAVVAKHKFDEMFLKKNSLYYIFFNFDMRVW